MVVLVQVDQMKRRRCASPCPWAPHGNGALAPHGSAAWAPRGSGARAPHGSSDQAHHGSDAWAPHGSDAWAPHGSIPSCSSSTETLIDWEPGGAVGAAS